MWDSYVFNFSPSSEELKPCTSLELFQKTLKFSFYGKMPLQYICGSVILNTERIEERVNHEIKFRCLTPPLKYVGYLEEFLGSSFLDKWKWSIFEICSNSSILW